MPALIVVMSEKKVKELARWIFLEQATGCLLPDVNPSQQLTLAVLFGFRDGRDAVELLDEVREKP